MKNFITRMALVRGYKLARKNGAGPMRAWFIVLHSFWKMVWFTGMDNWDVALLVLVSACVIGTVLLVWQ